MSDSTPSRVLTVDDVIAEIKAGPGGPKVAAFFDFDGTLSEIVNDPDSARLADGAADALTSLSVQCPVAILSGQTEVKNHFTIVPFSVLEEESGKVHRVMTSDDYMTPGSSGSVMYASARFHDPNPKLYAAVAAGSNRVVQIRLETRFALQQACLPIATSTAAIRYVRSTSTPAGLRLSRRGRNQASASAAVPLGWHQRMWREK